MCEFEISENDAVTIASNSLLTLFDNWYEGVLITARTICANDHSDFISQSDTAYVYPNLSPNTWDFDIDILNRNGLQFPPSNSGADMTLMVTLNAYSGNLDSWDMYIYYDFNYIQIDNCIAGSDWSDKTFQENTDSVLGEAHLGGVGGDSDGKSSVRSKLVTLAHCDIRVITTASVIVGLQSEIVELGI